MCDYSRDDYMDDKDFFKYDPNEDDDDDNDDDNNFIIFNNYDELMYLTNYTKTDDKVRDILYGLIKYVNIIKKKEVRFTFDYTIKPKHEWLDIAEEFKSNIEDGDYLILIDEDAIGCKVINEDLLK